MTAHRNPVPLLAAYILLLMINAAPIFLVPFVIDVEWKTAWAFFFAGWAGTFLAKLFSRHLPD